MFLVTHAFGFREAGSSASDSDEGRDPDRHHLSESEEDVEGGGDAKGSSISEEEAAGEQHSASGSSSESEGMSQLPDHVPLFSVLGDVSCARLC